MDDVLISLVAPVARALDPAAPYITLAFHPLAFPLCHLLFCFRLCVIEHQSLPRALVLCFGGTTVAAMVLAVPAFVVTSAWAVPILVGVYLLARLSPPQFKALVHARPLSYVFIVGADLARATVFHNWMTRAEDVLVHNATLGSLFVGCLVACSGVVLHAMVVGTEPDLTRVPPRLLAGVLVSRFVRFGLAMSRAHAHLALALFFVVSGLEV